VDCSDDGDSDGSGGGWVQGVMDGAVRGIESVAGGLLRLAVGRSGPRVLVRVDDVALGASVVFQQAGARAAHPHSFNDVVSLDLSPPH
jgi:hypothetical protein